MTKHFCDLCGKPAAENPLEYQQDGKGDLFGHRVGVIAVFEVIYDTSNETRRETPDLCADCQRWFLEGLLDKMKRP